MNPVSVQLLAIVRGVLRCTKLSALSYFKSQNILKESRKMSEKVRATAEHVKITLYRIR